MTDVNRIPEILKELEKVWKDNPDFRLGQLITVASKPSSRSRYVGGRNRYAG